MNQIPADTSLALDPILPIPLILVLAAVLATVTIYTYAKVGSHLGPRRNALLIILRLLGIALIILILLQPARVFEGTSLFYLIGVTFSLDWYLRRRWGLC